MEIKYLSQSQVGCALALGNFDFCLSSGPFIWSDTMVMEHLFPHIQCDHVCQASYVWKWIFHVNSVAHSHFIDTVHKKWKPKTKRINVCFLFITNLFDEVHTQNTNTVCFFGNVYRGLLSSNNVGPKDHCAQVSKAADLSSSKIHV